MYFVKKLRQAALGIAGLFSVPFGKKVEKSLSNIIDDKATIYDAKIDEFYNDFFEVFGRRRRDVAVYERAVSRLNNNTGFIDLFWKGKL